MRKLNQSGVSVVEVCLLIVLIGIIGGTGLYVYRAKLATNKTLSTAVDDAAAKSNGSLKVVTGQTSTSVNSSGSGAANSNIIKTTFSKSPAGLRAAIVATANTEAPDCVPGTNNGGDSAVTYASSGFATAHIGCDGGSVFLFAQTSGTWKRIDQTQDLFSCAAIETYHVPTVFLQATDPQGIAQCSTKTGGTEKL